ncbi:phosphinothricin acetyltransferase [Deinococcus hopiensis KR-140]|uniref:Phosphinothricin acetyltransferase n=1 Tax=Deinococcus hopiensis KR-140 TaxID=695939 RepID=A0A1W1UUB5_9DEIO|nr:phosphinothricin acetyltransferase [Deinococcus hopiensis KR-140]
MTNITARPTTLADAPFIAHIYTQGIEDRGSTFETRPRTAEDILSWFDGQHPIVVVERDEQVIAFASTSTYRPRDCYAGIAEFSVYVQREIRGTGAGKAAVDALIPAARAAGYWKRALTRLSRERRQPPPARLTWLSGSRHL